ncbi:hypothetical protein GSI_09732 [Ganoderma sinense ZZ0214-1]|uniref:Uncharacterized protein n=1 Tax=Ganoderma sinense ZZ0214-1 TaxID=1077348 RepID=A0A2G8S350_9APHY|nr:hypothetical protein GSI_09732 [Ganoderma sinense ZZ0214-1]
MGGCLWLTPVRANRREEIEESPLFDTSGDHEDGNNSWSYRYSGFQWLKGYTLRAGVQFLVLVQKRVDERKAAGQTAIAGARQFLADAGILAAATSPSDAKALDDASCAIAAAVLLLRSWIREPQLDQWGYPAAVSSTAFLSGGMQAQAPMPGLGSGGENDEDKDRGAALEEVLNTNFRFGELAKHEMCPPALHRVGLGGLFLLAKMWDNNQFVYPHEARVMAASLGRVVEFMDAEWREMAGELGELMRRCGEDEMSMIQG